MPDLSALIARVENGEGADRELDRDVWRAVCWAKHSRKIAAGSRLTSSVDALLEFAESILPGWRVIVSESAGFGITAFAACGPRERGSHTIGEHPTSMPRALLAAILRAVQAKGTSHD